MNWLLPQYLADALPAQANAIERLRRRILDICGLHGYELVMPPLLEHLESLLTGAAEDLNLRTFKLVDQLSGRSLGLRADITPQAARIDAHLLNRQETTRLCYCGSVVHTLPANITASREPIQLGAELYGFAGYAADLEIIRLMARALAAVKLPASRIDLGHAGIFRTLSSLSGLDKATEARILQHLQDKDTPALRELCAAQQAMPEDCRAAILALPQLYGDQQVLREAAKILPAQEAITAALATLDNIVAGAPELPFSIDLADLRGYHYHNGVVFAAYVPDYPVAIAQGGRYDGVGKAFGRERAATGFSLDLRELARLAPTGRQPGAIQAPYSQDPALAAAIAQLRESGEIVVEMLAAQQQASSLCDRRLVQVDRHWLIEALPPQPA